MMETLLILVRGLGGSGKTTLSLSLGSKLGISVFNRDDVKLTLKNSELASNKVTETAYSVMNDLAYVQIKNGVSAILDATARFKVMEERYLLFCNQNNAKFVSINCSCSDEIEWRKRIQERGSSHPVSFEETRAMEFQPFLICSQLDIDTSLSSRPEALAKSLLWLSDFSANHKN